MSHILLTGGMQRTGKDLLSHRKRIEVTSLGLNRKFCTQWADMFNTENYPLPNWKVTTNKGNALRVTEDQLILVKVNRQFFWKPIKQLEVGEPIAIFDWTLTLKMAKILEIVPTNYVDGGIALHTYNTNNFIANGIITSSRWPYYSKVFK